MTKGKSLRGHHLVITRRASIILLVINIISRGLWRRSKTSHASLPTGNVAYSGVHLTHLISEIVKTTTKVSLHPLKLLHNGIEGHTTSGERGRSGRKQSRRWWSRKTKPTLTAPVVGKRGERGMGMWKCWRIRVIDEGKISLSRVAVSRYTSSIDVMKWEEKSMERSSKRDRRKRGQGLVMKL